MNGISSLKALDHDTGLSMRDEDRESLTHVATAKSPRKSVVEGGDGQVDKIDESAVECLELQTEGTRNTEVLKNKVSLLLVSEMRGQPILRCGKRYAVVDGTGTAYVYEEK